MARRKTAPDGTPLHTKEFWIGLPVVCVIKWFDDEGNEWNPADIAPPPRAVSKANRGPTRTAKGIVKAKKVNVTFEEKIEARRKFYQALANLSEVNRGRILERFGRKNPREGMGVSGRDMRDIERAMIGVFEEMERESMRRAVPPTPTEVFIDALRDARAVDLGRIDGREM
jgi:hypothetical protein